MSTIVVMPGGFHPFHAGHMALYNSALKAFPDAQVYVAATNDTKTRPFPFQIKEKLAKVAGVAPGHFVQVKSPFQPREITSQYDPEKDVLIFVRSEKDKNESPTPGGTKKDGSPSYLQPYTKGQLQPFSKHAYMAYLPTVEFGPGITSATEIRNAWPKLDDRRKTAMVMSLYPATQKNPKLAANVVKMLDMAMGEQAVSEDAPGMKDGRPYSDPLRRHPGNESYMTPEYLIQKYKERLAQIASGPYKRPKEVAQLQSRIAKLQKQGLNEFAPDNGDDGLPYAEFVVYQCDPNDQFEFIGSPLYQSDNLGMAHKYAYEMFLKHRPKAFVIYQPHKEASRGNYGVKDERGVIEGFGLPMPTTYEQERGIRTPSKAQHITAMTNEDHDMDPEMKAIYQKAIQHYPNAKDKQEAFVKYVQRALMHSEVDDTEQNQRLEILDKEVDQLQKQMKQVNVSESADYLDEK